MKIGKFIEDNRITEIFFLKNDLQNVVKKLFPDSVLKKLKSTISLHQMSEVCSVCFYCMLS